MHVNLDLLSVDNILVSTQYFNCVIIIIPMATKQNKKTVLPSDDKCHAAVTTSCKIIIKQTTRAISIIKDYSSGGIYFYYTSNEVHNFIRR